MKKILITGANSYIGTSFEKYMATHYPEDYAIDTVDMIDGTWRDKDFSKYDCVFHRNSSREEKLQYERIIGCSTSGR